MDEATRVAIDCYAAYAAPGPALFPEAIERAEKLIGSMPDALAHFYQACGNGEFGPCFRPLILEGDPQESRECGFEEASVVGATLIERSLPDEEAPWPSGLIRILNWGCGIESCVDTKDSRLRIVRFDPNYIGVPDGATLDPRAAYPMDVVGTKQTHAFVVEAGSLASWLDTWREGLSMLAMQQMGTPLGGRSEGLR